MAGQANPGQISETEFTRLLQLLSSTSKGRAFLNEYRERFRPEETLGLLDSLKHIEGSMSAVRDQLQPEAIANELRNIAMSLDLAIEGAEIDPEGDETARRFALADQARSELLALAATFGGGDDGAQRAVPDGNAASGAGYRLRDSAVER
jgi:hypothetical protein